MWEREETAAIITVFVEEVKGAIRALSDHQPAWYLYQNHS